MFFNFRKIWKNSFNAKKAFSFYSNLKPVILNQDIFHIKKIKLPKLKQIRYLFRFLTKKEKIIVYILLFIGLMSLFSFIFRINRTATIYLPSFGGQYIEGIVGQPKLINPLFASKNDTDLDIVRLVYSGLFRYDKDLNIVPDLVDHYTANEEKTHYYFYLKKNIFWHDGERFTSDDIIFTFAKIKEYGLNDYFKDVNFKKIDNFQIEAILLGPKKNFLNRLTVGILPKHIWENVPRDKMLKSVYNLKPIGTGPFIFESFIRDKTGKIYSYTLKRNERFYFHPPYISKIIFKFFDNFDDELSALQTGQIDGLKYVPLSSRDILSNFKHLRGYKLKLPQFTALFLNLNDKILQSKTIRKVLAYATPKKKIVGILNGNGKIISCPVVSDISLKQSVDEKYQYNQEKAKKILENAGWNKNENGYFEKDGNLLEVKISTVNQDTLKKVGELIQESWQNVGIKTSLAIYPLDIFNDEVVKMRKYQVLLCGIIKNFNSDLNYALWHSSQIKGGGINLSNFSNKRVDELLEKVNKMPYKNIREKKYKEIQDILLEEVPAIFLYTIEYQYFLPKKVKGFAIEKINLPCDRFNNITDWYIKTKRTRK